MKHITTTGPIAVLVALVLLLAVSTALAQDSSRPSAPFGAGYDLSWWTVDGGGDSVSNGGSGYALLGTAGQPDAGALADGGFTMTGGFWGGAAVENRIYLPFVLRDSS